MENIHSHLGHSANGLLQEIRQQTAVNIQACYQCGKCSAGCPLAGEMDFPPSLLMRMIQVNKPETDEKVLGAYSMWVCLTCNTCSSRCPMEIDIPRVMDHLREKSFTLGKTNKKASPIIDFHKAFLKSIEVNGRLHELGLIVYYKMLTFRLMQDVMLAPGMLLRGKLHLFPERIRQRKQLAGIYKRTLKRRKELEV